MYANKNKSSTLTQHILTFVGIIIIALTIILENEGNRFGLQGNVVQIIAILFLIIAFGLLLGGLILTFKQTKNNSSLNILEFSKALQLSLIVIFIPIEVLMLSVGYLWGLIAWPSGTNVILVLLAIIMVLISGISLFSIMNPKNSYLNSSSKKNKFNTLTTGGLISGFNMLIIIIIWSASWFKNSHFYLFGNSYISGQTILIIDILAFGITYFIFYIMLLTSASEPLKLTAALNLFGFPLFIMSLMNKNHVSSNNGASVSKIESKNNDDEDNVVEKVEEYDDGKGNKVIKKTRTSSSTSTSGNGNFPTTPFDIDMDGDIEAQLKEKMGVDIGNKSDNPFDNKRFKKDSFDKPQKPLDEYQSKENLKIKLEKLRKLKAQGLITDEELVEQQRLLIAEYSEIL